MSDITDHTKLRTDLVMPIPNLRNRVSNNLQPSKDSPFVKSVNKATRMMHKHAGIRKGRQSI